MIVEVIGAIVGAATGWFVVFWASEHVLSRALARSDSWWNSSVCAYQLYKQTHPDTEPLATASGEEGALGIWRDDALAAAGAGLLTQERLEILAGMGVVTEGLVSSGTEKQRRERCLILPTWWQRALCAAVLAGVAGASCAFMASVLSAGLFFVCTVAMLVAVVCDVHARIIPLETCGVLGVVGIIFQATAQGVDGVLAGVAFCLVIVAVCSVINKMMRFRCPRGAVGKGDVRCMGALSLATGVCAIGGFAACYLVAGVVAVLGCVSKKLTLADGLPMAPFLFIWLVFSAVMQVVVPEISSYG